MSILPIIFFTYLLNYSFAVEGENCAICIYMEKLLNSNVKCSDQKSKFACQDAVAEIIGKETQHVCLWDEKRKPSCIILNEYACEKWLQNIGTDVQKNTISLESFKPGISIKEFAKCKKINARYEGHGVGITETFSMVLTTLQLSPVIKTLYFNNTGCSSFADLETIKEVADDISKRIDPKIDIRMLGNQTDVLSSASNDTSLVIQMKNNTANIMSYPNCHTPGNSCVESNRIQKNLCVDRYSINPNTVNEYCCSKTWQRSLLDCETNPQ